MLVPALLGIPNLDNIGVRCQGVDMPVVMGFSFQMVTEPGCQPPGPEGAADIRIETF
jgi:hypothetical protein